MLYLLLFILFIIVLYALHKEDFFQDYVRILWGLFFVWLFSFIFLIMSLGYAWSQDSIMRGRHSNNIMIETYRFAPILRIILLMVAITLFLLMKSPLVRVMTGIYSLLCALLILFSFALGGMDFSGFGK